jgi:hypothetical protein
MPIIRINTDGRVWIRPAMANQILLKDENRLSAIRSCHTRVIADLLPVRDLTIAIHAYSAKSLALLAFIIAPLSNIHTLRLCICTEILPCHVVALPTPSVIRILRYTAVHPSALAILCQFSQHATYVHTDSDPHNILHPSWLPSVTFVRIFAGIITANRHLLVAERFPHLTHIRAISNGEVYFYIPSPPLMYPPSSRRSVSMCRLCVQNNHPRIQFDPNTSYLHAFFDSITQSPLGAILASFFLSVDRFTTIDPLVAARIPRHLSSRDGVLGPESDFLHGDITSI